MTARPQKLLLTCLTFAAVALSLVGVALAEGVRRQHPVLGEYQLDQALEIELVAQEPLIFDPIDLEFDRYGEAFVLEMIGFPITSEQAAGPSRVVKLTDSDGDGRFDQRQVFADGLRYASSILPYLDGLLVVDPPDLLYLRDTSGDGRADLRQVLLSGFAVGPSESNFNGLTYGPDNWVYGANGSSGGAVFFPHQPGQKTSIRGQDLRFRFAPEPGDSGRLSAGEIASVGQMGGGYGVTFDTWGRRYVTHEQRHIQAALLPYRYLDAGRTTFAGISPAVLEISDHGQGETARVFPISTTQRRPNHPEQAGFFTAGCGLTHFGSDALGPEYVGNFFVGEAVHNLVHRDVLDDSRLLPVARRATSELRSEFLAVKDSAFRAVNYAVGPDGALYLVDMQRDIIEHPEWIPDEIEATLDLRAGEDRGRIYRIRRGDRTESAPKTTKTEDLDLSTVPLQIEALSHPNQWRRFTSQRLLVERVLRDPSSQEAIAAQLIEGLSQQGPTGRLHRLFTLDGIGALNWQHTALALEDQHPRVQEAALRLAEQFLVKPEPDDGLSAKVLQLTSSPDPRLRLQAVLTAGLMVSTPARTQALTQQARSSSQHSSLFETALLLGVARSSSDFTLPFSRGLAEHKVSPSLFAGLAELITKQGDPRETADLLELSVALDVADRRGALEALGKSGATSAVDAGVARKMERSLKKLDLNNPGSSPEETLLAWRITQRYGLRSDNTTTAKAVHASTVVRDRGQSTEERLRQIPLLEILDQATRTGVLLDILTALDPTPIQLGALEQLSQIQSPEIAPALVDRWRTLSPKVRTRAGDLLLQRRSNHEVLLDALENGPILIGEMNLHLERRRTLLRWSTPEVGERAQKLFSDTGVNTRREAYEQALSSLELEGDPVRGTEVFNNLCSRCHHIAGLGSFVGPDLTDVFRKSGASLLHDIIDPNAQVSNEFLAYDIETKTGELYSGLLVSETDLEIVLRSAEGVERTFSRLELETLESSGLSLMPEELEIGLEPSDIASLLAFLQSPR